MKLAALFVLASSLLALFTVQSSAPPAASGSRRYINLPNARAGRPFSDAILVGETLYLAGRIGIDPKTGKPAATPEDEARLILDGMKAVLAEAGMTMDDLVYVQVFCPDVAQYDKFNAVYRGYFGKEMPARAFVGSGPLLFNATFEVQGIAVRR